MKQSQLYNLKFYSKQAIGSYRSACEIVKLVKEAINPRSVVDVGCGIGTWLKVWSECGMEDIFGIDGDYIRSDQLLIPPDRFMSMNLSAPTALAKKFDFVQSLEVAEHLPEASAESFVSFLCSLGSIVLFGAAIPYQGGTSHINEQWPEYWAELFGRKGYVAIDALRERVWNNPSVEWWYCQNTVIFVQAEHLKTLEGLRECPVVPPQGSLSKVHPRLWLARNERDNHLETVLLMLPKSIREFHMRAFRWLRRTAAK